MDMENFSIAIDGDGVAIVSYDVPGRSMNTVTQAVQRDLDRLVDRIKADDAIRGVVIRSGKPSGFCAGADLVEMQREFANWRRAEGQAELAAGVEGAAAYTRRLRALETCGKPVVAAIAGLALGGGLELALACHHRIGGGSGVRLGLPEATIGLMPGAGATQRLPRLMGIDAALPHLLEGTPITEDAALASGVLHAVVPDDQVIEACRRYILEGGSAVAPWDEKRFALPGGGPHSPAGYRSFPYAVARLCGERGAHYPAQANILRAVYEGSQVPIDAALRIESRYFFNTVRTPRAEAMVHTLFVTRQATNKAGPPAWREGLIAVARGAWMQEARILVDEGLSPTLVAGIAARAGGWRVDKLGTDGGAPDFDLLPEAMLEQAGARLLHATGVAVQNHMAMLDIADTDHADLVAVDAGFPAWTGGPIAYLRSHPV